MLFDLVAMMVVCVSVFFVVFAFVCVHLHVVACDCRLQLLLRSFAIVSFFLTVRSSVVSVVVVGVLSVVVVVDRVILCSCYL